MTVTGRIRLVDTGEDLAWQDDAACAGKDPDLFFPDKWVHVSVRAATADAKAICARCPVRDACLEYALRSFNTYTDTGIYGGTTPRERRRIRKQRKVA